jgi:hypothetical protein
LILIADTNVLVRPVVLCELVWVLRRAYGFAEGEISGAPRALIEADTVRLDRPAAEDDLALLAAAARWQVCRADLHPPAAVQLCLG